MTCLQVNADGFTQKTIALGTAHARTFTYTRDGTTKAVTDVTDSSTHASPGTRTTTATSPGITRLHSTADAVTENFTYDAATSVLETATDRECPGGHCWTGCGLRCRLVCGT